MNRNFERTTLDSEYRGSAYKITCCRCEAVDKIGVGSHSGSLPPEVIAKKFKQRGWRIGNRVSLDVCQDCLTQEKLSRRVIKLPELTANDLEKLGLGAHKLEVKPTPEEEKLMTIKEIINSGRAAKATIYRYISDGKLPVIDEPGKILRVKESDVDRVVKDIRRLPARPTLHLKMPPPVNAPAPTVNEQTPLLNDGDVKVTTETQQPQVMTKEDRRIIFSEIDSHYLDELRGYAKDWDDERVAAGLKVSIEWVRAIREDNFGAEKGDQISVEVEKLKAASAEAEKLIQTMRTLWESMDKTLEEFEAKQAALSAEATKVHATIAEAKGKIDAYTK